MNELILNTNKATMTLKEITDLLNVRHNDAMRSVEKMAQEPEFGELRNFRSSYINNLGAELPVETYLLDKRQSLAVAARLNTAMLMRVIDRWQELEAESKPMTMVEIVAAQSQILLEMERRQVAIEAKAAEAVAVSADNARRLDQIETATDHFTIMGWHRYARMAGSLPLADATRMGKAATAFCHEHDLAVGEVPDPRFGKVKTYPKWVLDEMFGKSM